MASLPSCSTRWDSMQQSTPTMLERLLGDIATKETGLLIGQKGETIDSIQYLLNVVVYEIALSSKDHRRYRGLPAEESQKPSRAWRTDRQARPAGEASYKPSPWPPPNVAWSISFRRRQTFPPGEGGEEDRRVVIS